MAEEIEIEEQQEKIPAGMVRTETGRLITKAADNAWRTKQAAAMTEQRKQMLLRGMKKKADDVSETGGLENLPKKIKSEDTKGYVGFNKAANKPGYSKTAAYDLMMEPVVSPSRDKLGNTDEKTVEHKKEKPDNTSVSKSITPQQSKGMEKYYQFNEGSFPSLDAAVESQKRKNSMRATAKNKSIGSKIVSR